MTDSPQPPVQNRRTANKGENHESRNKTRCPCVLLCRSACRCRVCRGRESNESKRAHRVSSLAATASGTITSSGSPRSGDLHVTKDCDKTYNFQAGDFCTITSSNVDAIEVGSKVFYAWRRISLLSRWTVTSFSPAGARQQSRVRPLPSLILRPVSDCARSRAGPGNSLSSMQARTSRPSVGSTSPGTGHTASVRANEPRTKSQGTNELH